MFASAGEWVTSMELAPPASRGSYLSIFSLGNSLQDAIGPTFITVVLLLGAAWLWPLLAALVCAGMLSSAVIAGRTTIPGASAPPKPTSALQSD
jgi:MFS family permease